MKRVENAHKRLVNSVVSGAARMKGAAAAVQRKFQGVGQAIGRMATLGKIALAGLAIAAVVTGAKFEQSMANVAAVSGAVGDQLEELTATARGLGATTAFSASQASEAMLALAQAGQSVAQIGRTVGSVLLFAGAAQTSLGGSAETLVQTLAQFNLKAEQSARVVNVFAASMSASLLNAERLTEGMSQVGSTASAVGLRLEETVAALGLLNSAGQLGGIAGTRLKNVLVRLAAPNQVLQELLGKTSLATDGLAVSMEALKDADPGKIFKAFGRIAGPAVLIMRSQRKEFEALEATITGTNKAQEMFEIQMNTVASQTKIFKSQLQENMIATFFAMRDAGFNALDALTRKLKEIKPFVVGLVAVTVRWFQENSELVRSLVRTGAIIGGTVAAVAFLTSGIGLIVTGVIAATVAWSKWGDQITEFTQTIVGRVVEFARTFLETNEVAVAGVLGGFKDFANGMIGTIVFLGLTFFDLGANIIQALKGPLEWAWGKAKWLAEKAAAVFGWLSGQVSKAFEDMKDDIADPELAGSHSKMTRQLVENAEQAYGTDYVAAVGSGLGKAVTVAKEKLDQIAGKANETAAAIKKAGEAAGGAVQAPGAQEGGGAQAEAEKAQAEASRRATERANAEIKAALAVEDARRAALVRTIGFESAATQAWLDARLELIRSNFNEEELKHSGSQEKLAELAIEKSEQIKAARMEHQDAVHQQFLTHNEAAIATLGLFGAAYDQLFSDIARGEISTQRLRESAIRSVRATFVENTAAMIKEQIKQTILGLAVTSAAQDAAHKKTRFQAAKEGAVKAYSAFASIPIIGPILGAAAAAAAFGFLMAFARGGRVPGIGFGRDSVPSILEPDEHVITRSAATSVGHDNLDFINRTGTLPPPAAGGAAGAGVELTLVVPEGSGDVVDDMVEYLEEDVIPVLADMNKRGRGLSRRRTR